MIVSINANENNRESSFIGRFKIDSVIEIQIYILR